MMTNDEFEDLQKELDISISRPLREADELQAYRDKKGLPVQGDDLVMKVCRVSIGVWLLDKSCSEESERSAVERVRCASLDDVEGALNILQGIPTIGDVSIDKNIETSSLVVRFDVACFDCDHYMISEDTSKKLAAMHSIRMLASAMKRCSGYKHGFQVAEIAVTPAQQETTNE